MGVGRGLGLESREVVTEEEEDPLEDLVAQERDLAAEVEVDVVVVVELEAMEVVEAVGDAEEVEVMVEVEEVMAVEEAVKGRSTGMVSEMGRNELWRDCQ